MEEKTQSNIGQFKVGNQLWKARTTVGRTRVFETPEAMWMAAEEYFKWVDENPLYTYDVKSVDKTLEEVSIPRARPYTLMGLCIFLGVSSAYFRQFKADKDKCTPDFSTVIQRIEDIIYTQKFDGASAGFFNANIISRDLGLADKQEIKANVFNEDTPLKFD